MIIFTAETQRARTKNIFDCFAIGETIKDLHYSAVSLAKGQNCFIQSRLLRD